MVCPNCNHNLTPLTIKTEGNGKLEIDHCYFCGGVWFDHFEINRFPLTHSLHLLEVTQKSFKQELSGSGKCPKDSTNLKILKTDSVPQDITVLSCPKCGGNFISKVELANLKIAQKVKLDYFKTWKIPLPALSTVLIPVVLFIATVGVFLTVRNVQQNQEARIKAQELIGTPTIVVSERNSVLVSFSTNVPVLSTVVYKSEDEKEPHTIPVGEQRQKTHTVTLQNLKPRMKYTLKIYVENIPGEVLSSPTYTFTTN